MDEIAEREFLAMNIASLDKSYNHARLTGMLASDDIYIANAIYKLFTACGSNISYEMHRKLFFMYNHVLDKSDQACRPKIAPECLLVQNHKTSFIQRQKEDCDNTPPLVQSIYYWQEPLYSTVHSDVEDKLTPEYLKDKPNALVPEFETGKDLVCTNVGISCFAIIRSIDTSVWSVTD